MNTQKLLVKIVASLVAFAAPVSLMLALASPASATTCGIDDCTNPNGILLPNGCCREIMGGYPCREYELRKCVGWSQGNQKHDYTQVNQAVTTCDGNWCATE